MLSQDHIDCSSGNDDSSRGSPPRGTRLQLKKGPWTPSEDVVLEAYVKKHGEGNWNAVQKNTTLLRCGKSCRLRWANHLRPNLKKGAFTKEEENLIIKLHYEMGNKWARMAAYLPGRTDNEIKNYWNTRIKKCQRTKAPIHPSNICLQTSNEDQYESTDFSFSEKLANDPLHGNGLYVPQLSDVSISNILSQSIASKNYGFMDQVNQEKVLKESESSLPMLDATNNGMFSSVDQSLNKSEKLEQAFGFDFHNVTNSIDKTMAPSVGASFESHAFSNGNFSASRPTTGPLKMELPSLQDAESDPNNRSMHLKTSAVQPANFADPCMHSSAATLSAKSQCMAPRNSGQLEEVLPEPNALSSIENQQLSVGSLSTSVGTSCDAMMESSKLDLCEEFWEQDPNFYTLISSDFSASPLCPVSPDDYQHSEISPAHSLAFGPSELIVPQYEQAHFSPHLEDFNPDALFSWNTIGSSIFNDTIGMLLEDDADTEWKPVSCGTTIFPK